MSKTVSIVNQKGGQIDARGGLAHAAFLIDN